MKAQWPSLSSVVAPRAWASPPCLIVTPAAAISPSKSVDFPLPFGPTRAIERGFLMSVGDEGLGMRTTLPNL
jgi:hypothetical protein